MNTKSIFILTSTLLTASVTFGQVSQVVSDIAPYVYPQNSPAAPPSFTYAPDGNGYLLLSSDKRTVDRYDIATGKKIETVFDISTAREVSLPLIEGYEMSNDGRYLLVYINKQFIYRRSFTAEYYVYEVRSKLLKPLSTQFKVQQAPLFSPDGLMISFVAENNIYIKKLVYNSEVQVTKDGEANKIINGVPDWVYEEEFATNQSMAWAPDNSTLCYLRYDEEKVPMYTLPLYQGTCDPMDEYAYYPGIYSYKYPVAGETNSKVTLHSYDVDNRKTKDIELPDNKIEYIPHIEYGGQSAERLMVVTLNRDQNHMEIYSVNPKSTLCKSIYTEDAKAWIDPSAYENLILADNYFLVRSSRSGYNQLYKYSYAGEPQATISLDGMDVTASYGGDSKGNFYYQAASPTPMDRVVYKYDIKGKSTIISKDKGTSAANFSPDKAYAMMKFSDAQTPPIYTINNADGKQLRILEDNAAYAARVANMPKREFFTMQSEGNTLNGYILKSASASGRMPVIMYQYSGPGSQSVLNTWSMDWENYFAMNGFVVVCVDGRGTGGRGRQFMDAVYMQLGKYETIDQVNAAKWVAQQPWADPKRIGIHGWSFGGYETILAASATDNPYAAAVAIAPVTSWKFYDTIYTERYMRTPQQNEQGYYEGSPLYKVNSLSCPLLIMYGTADDNVHPQNSIQYVSRLQSVGGLCDMFIFPNMNHSIFGCNSRAVVYAKMFDYFRNHLK